MLLRGVERRNIFAKSSLARLAIAWPKSSMRYLMKGGFRVRLYVG